MVIQNKCYEIGDELLIEVKVNRRGVYTLTSFTDLLGNESNDRYFTKQVSVSLDSGVTWSNYATISNGAITISNQSVDEVTYIIYRFRYVRAGNDTTSYVEFNSLQLKGTISVIQNKQIIIYKVKVSGQPVLV